MASVNRRAFTKLVVMAAGAVGAVGLVAYVPEKKFGRINCHEDFYGCRNKHASVDGVEVTNECFEADDVNGYALCYVKDERGFSVVDRDRGELKWERLNGDVRIWEA